MAAEAAIFDVDGTLVDSVDLHASAWQEAFARFGRRVGFDEVRAQIGKGGDQLMPVFLSQAELALRGKAIEEHRSQIWNAEYLKRVRAFPRVLVETETSADDAARSKPHPDIFAAALRRVGAKKEAALVIGDSPWDAIAARRLGVRSIGVLCGGFAEADLLGAGCSAIYRDPADLLARLEESPLLVE